MEKLFIITQSDFDTYCLSLMQKEKIAIDTEFMRVKTYYPEFALLQLATDTEIAIVDPLKIQDWHLFKNVLDAPTVSKIFHAASEDLALFWHFFQTLPKPYIDTQVLCSFIKDGTSLGLANALKEFLDISINKDQTRTDWLVRPLTDSQISYAYNDVEYLLALYEKIDKQLCDRKRHFALTECTHLANKVTQEKNISKLYLQAPHVEKLNEGQLALLQTLTIWRYQEAIKRNLALNFIVHEKHLISLVEKLPDSLYELNKLGMHANEINHHGCTIIQLIEEYKTGAFKERKLPKVKLLHTNPRYKEDFAKIKFAFEKIASDENLSAQLLGSRKQINQLLTLYYEKNANNDGDKYLPIAMGSEIISQIDILSNWRKDVCSFVLSEMGFISFN
ncbi:ribonuclease D [Thorsellia kenyensis]|uniref:Ribonuclease D n=1 Tax=Thorsellia kenyensis TaxID=1549888 RepID=A0ABV6C8B6_9GAMM